MLCWVLIFIHRYSTHIRHYFKPMLWSFQVVLLPKLKKFPIHKLYLKGHYICECNNILYAYILLQLKEWTILDKLETPEADDQFWPCHWQQVRFFSWMQSFGEPNPDETFRSLDRRFQCAHWIVAQHAIAAPWTPQKHSQSLGKAAKPNQNVTLTTSLLLFLLPWGRRSPDYDDKDPLTIVQWLPVIWQSNDNLSTPVMALSGTCRQHRCFHSYESRSVAHENFDFLGTKVPRKSSRIWNWNSQWPSRVITKSYNVLGPPWKHFPINSLCETSSYKTVDTFLTLTKSAKWLNSLS